MRILNLLVLCVAILSTARVVAAVPQYEDINHLRSMADAGIPEAQFDLAANFHHYGLYEDALVWYLKAAEQGHADAYSNLALLHAEGLGVVEDNLEAVRLYGIAINRGSSVAAENLGMMYLAGKGVPQNFAEARRLLTVAALDGSPEAQSRLARMHFNGEGEPRNLMAAYIWAALAAAQGHENSAHNRDLVAGMLSEEELAEAQAISSQCYLSKYVDCVSHL